jgi:hypothetical protein
VRWRKKKGDAATSSTRESSSSKRRHIIIKKILQVPVSSIAKRISPKKRHGQFGRKVPLDLFSLPPISNCKKVPATHLSRKRNKRTFAHTTVK